jgi:hypothetical protein
MRREDFPGGYFGCCGRSRARGHADTCQRSITVYSVAEALEVRAALKEID